MEPSSAPWRVIESAPGVFVVTLAGARDEISAAPKKFSYLRTQGNQ